jgi:predicted dehydrogenase
MEWQLRNWYYFTWLSGDHLVEQHVHCLDLMAWVMQGEYPVRAVGCGGRQARTGPEFGHIFDHHAICYEFASGVRCHSYCRQQDQTAQDISNWAFGAKGTADLLRRTISGRTRSPGPWGGHQEEQDALFESIRTGRPINNGEYMAKSTLMAIMGRMATYTGQEITWDAALNSAEDLTPARYEFGPLPTPPVAVPGLTPFT